MRRPFLPACTALTGLLAGFAVALVTAAPPAAAEEVVERPADGVFAVEGHGWGHGRGMSQWGAQGAASLGVPAETIVSTYYPGTTRSVLAPAPIRVKLQGDDGHDLVVHPAAGLRVTDLASGASAELPAGPSRWRVVVGSAGLHVQSLSGTTWSPYALGGATAHAGPVRFSGAAFHRVAFANGTSRDYRGVVQAVRTSPTALASVVVLDLEDYLLGVVPRESSASWKPAALQAQAIAARSYSANKRERVAGAGHWDICDTTQCQVFGGSRLYSASGTVTELEPATTTDAVRATAGVVRTYGGRSIFAEFSSSNGGWSTTGDFPYLRAQRDDWDGALPNPVHAWKASLRAADLERRFPAVGTLTRLRVTARDGNGEWGGRVKSVVLEGVSSTGAATSVSTTGAGVYSARSWPASSDGLRSSWWRILAPSAGSSSIVFQSATPTLVRPPGRSTGTLDVALRNTGTTAWPVAGLHLAIASPAGAADALAAGATRPGVLLRNATRPGASTVEPGETADFRVRVDAAGVQPGSYERTYRLRVDAGPVFGVPVSWTVPVHAAVLTAAPTGTPTAVTGALLSGGPPAVFADGRTVVVPRTGSTTVRMTFRATGNVHWPAGAASPVQLGTSGPRNRASASYGTGWTSPSRAQRLHAGADGGSVVAPGGEGVFQLQLHGGGHPVGVSTEAFEPLWGGVGWLEGAARTLDVVRVDPAVSRLAGVDTAPPATATLSPGGSTTLVVRLRNLGGSPWPVGAERLATAGDAAYPLATSAWASASRPPALAANLSRPGTSAVHPGEVGEWRIPLWASGRAGTHRLSLQALGPDGRYGPLLTTDVTVTAPPRATFKGSGPAALR